MSAKSFGKGQVQGFWGSRQGWRRLLGFTEDGADLPPAAPLKTEATWPTPSRNREAKRKFRLKALVAGPRFDEGAVYREVLLGQEALPTGLFDDRLEEACTIQPFHSRSRFLLKHRRAHTGSSRSRPTNQRNSRLLSKLFHQQPLAAHGVSRSSPPWPLHVVSASRLSSRFRDLLELRGLMFTWALASRAA
jgi:hypothetical protein